MKQKRHEKIIDIIKNNDIETQEDLQARLKNAGFFATQATISRDMHELNVIKVASGSGKYRYVQRIVADPSLEEKFSTILKESIKAIDIALNIVVVHSYTGMASAACAAIDAMKMPEVVGSVAGDDTLILITKSVDEAKKLYDNLKNDTCQ